jgi:cytoskeleton protein RodZ
VEETESLGRYLKKERELRNISLREVSKNTKVKEHLLKAIEEDQYFSLPSHTYIKGFLLSYAKYLGLDPNDVLLRFEGSLKGKPVASPEVPSEKRMGWNMKYLLGIGGIAIVGLFVSYVLFLHPSKTTKESTSVKPKVEEVLPSPPQIAGTISVPEEQPFSVQLKAVEETWVRIQINGEPDRDMTLKPGESTSHQALKRIHLLVGNAGGLDIIFKGKSLGRFGKSGEVVNLTFTAQGVETKGLERSKPE